MNTRLTIISILFGVLGTLAQRPDGEYFENRIVDKLGPSINSEHFEGFPMIMPDGLTLYFSSDRPGGLGDLDIYVTHRKSINDPWEPPIPLGNHINSPASDHSITLSGDGHYMYFTSEKKGGFGDADLYVSYRKDVTVDSAWEKAKNLGEVINTEKSEACPLFHYENGDTKLYYMGYRENGVGLADLYYSVLDMQNKVFTEPVLLGDVSSISKDMHFEPVTGLIWSDRKEGIGQDDIWIASFDESDQSWQKPVCLKYPINTEHSEGMPTVTHNLSELYFHSDRPGGFGSHDIYLAEKNSH